MKTWDKVTIDWDFFTSGVCTSVRMNGRLDPNAYDPQVFDSKIEEGIHGLFKMKVHSYENSARQRMGEMLLDIRRHRGPNVPPRSKELIGLLKAKFEASGPNGLPVCKYGVSVEGPATESWTDTKFLLRFVLADGEQFCDTAIDIGSAVFEALGVNDVSGVYLARFSIRRESFVMLDGAWITFAKWLRISHLLPVMGPEDEIT